MSQNLRDVKYDSQCSFEIPINVHQRYFEIPRIRHIACEMSDDKECLNKLKKDILSATTVESVNGCLGKYKEEIFKKAIR